MISSSTVNGLSENLQAATRVMLGEFIHGAKNALSFLEKPKVDGKALDLADRDLILHFAIRELVAQTLTDPNPVAEGAEENRLVQWESALAVALVRSGGKVSSAITYQPLLKAFEGLVQNGAHIDQLEKVLVEVAGGRAKERSFVRALLNQVEGKFVSTAGVDLAAEELSASARESVKEFGRILAGRIQVGGPSGAHFLVDELGEKAGISASDRDLILYFATQELAKRSVKALLTEAAEQERPKPKSALKNAAAWWESYCGALRATWKTPEGMVPASLGAVCEALRLSGVSGEHRDLYLKIFRAIKRPEHQLLFKYLLNEVQKGQAQEKSPSALH